MAAMRRFTFIALPLALLAFAPAPSALAQEAETASAEQTIPATQAERLDDLFADLKRTSEEGAAKEISNRIRLEWQDSGSATVNLLIQWADKAMTEDKNTTALDYLDEIVTLRPDYVEGWNRRATLHFKMGNFRKSMSDINAVLELEPRHFGAIAGMAAILSTTGRDESAMEAWQRFLEIYPSERRAQKEYGDLVEKLAGQRT